MLQATLVTAEEELTQIHQLNQQNLKQNLSAEEKQKEGFVTWLYSLELLQRMHQLAPSVIVKYNDAVAAYALVTLRAAAEFHPDLQSMVDNLESISYREKALSGYSYYCMGQVCIDKEFRGQGVFNLLYQKHKEVYGSKYDLLVTEVSSSNIRSQKAHEKVGFRTIHTYTDNVDVWNVVVWDWT